MTLDEYQQAAERTAAYPNRGHNLVYPVLGLASEAGEVAGKLKKAIRDTGGQLSEDQRARLLDEVGDVLWYVAAICAELDTSLEAVARANLDKLASRAERGVIGGDGDKR
ncbi:MAG: nucleoside triphosphate pyrophosphohydrolase family protein [Chloracidobacterium sp.]|uniref:Nucleoside triphosphate pyrophosphohydrolase family protein n=1 Tax=Chloracidobacterium validum TaxID=2821543 RepID=A0ABX8BE63_9BACT|nr:nucleoside triphosphate pyrophosphohydrolase family protein [Chloracidobacterium validum]QUW03944.1 nucleoside triphosphate pyrophosphohydrolase family protein [Chloracidobacterium validum]